MEKREDAAEGIGTLLKRIGDDVKIIAKDEVELIRYELGKGTKKVAVDTGAVLLGAFVALIGAAMLCSTAVVALEPVIESLTVRMLIMSLSYLAVGAVLVGVFVKKLKADMPPDMEVSKAEAKRTVNAIKQELQHAH